MNSQNYYLIEKALNYIDTNKENQPSLDEIAKHIGLSPFHFQKIFKDWAGISPKKFLQFLTIEYAKDILNKNNVLDTTFESGLSSTSRLYDLFFSIEAMSPAEYKLKGKGLVITYGFHESPFGKSLIAMTERGICGLSFINDEKEGIKELKSGWPNAVFKQNENKTFIYFDQIFGNSKDRNIKILLKGTKFQIQVWKALLTLQPGELTTYSAIASKVKNPKATRAVGTAVGSNNLAYLIPCHRVINKIGMSGNYRWGRSRKKAMIGYELSLAGEQNLS